MTEARLSGIGVEFFHFGVEGVLGIPESLVGLAEKFVEILAAVVTRDLFVEVPPDSFDRVGLPGQRLGRRRATPPRTKEPEVPRSSLRQPANHSAKRRRRLHQSFDDFDYTVALPRC